MLKKSSRAGEGQGARSAGCETYQADRRASEHRATQPFARAVDLFSVSLGERIEAWSVKQPAGAMARALQFYGLANGPAGALERMVDAECETLIQHEMGEWQAGELLDGKPSWSAMITELPRRSEIVARALRDDLADLLGTLPMLIKRRAWGSIHLWFAAFDGMRRHLLSALPTAYEAAVAADDPKIMLAPIHDAVERLSGQARAVLQAYREAGVEAARHQLAAIEAHPAP